MWWFRALLFLASGPLAVSARQPCPVYGPLFPAPTNLRDHPRTKVMAKELESILQQRQQGGESNYSYVLQTYTTNEGVLWQHSYTSPKLRTLNTTGVKEVDENSVHRIGSITKMLTVYAFLIQIGDRVWYDPVTKYIPELRSSAAHNSSGSPIYSVDWDEVTVGSLASFESGLLRDFTMLGELTAELPDWKNVLPQIGYPIIPADEIPPCGKNPVCSRKDFLAGMAAAPPFSAPYQTAMYNNANFVLLSYVAEAITGKPFMQMIEDTIIKPLNLSRTFISTPNDSYGVIPGDRDGVQWTVDLGNEAPTGNAASSAGDLTRLGQAIMGMALLKPAATRRWLKPVAFLANPTQLAGKPWTIDQVPLGHKFQFVTALNKVGHVGGYKTEMVILPDLDVGLTIMVSALPWELPDNLNIELSKIMREKLLDLWLDVGREQAQANYGGNYATAGSGPNSTMTIRVDDGGPGMGLLNWSSNGVDMIPLTVAFGWSLTPEELTTRLRPSARMYPTRLEEPLPDGGRRVSFRAVFEDLSDDPVLNSYVPECDTWLRTLATYGAKPVDLFVFTLDKSGRAVSVENMALRTKLERVS